MNMPEGVPPIPFTIVLAQEGTALPSGPAVPGSPGGEAGVGAQTGQVGDPNGGGNGAPPPASPFGGGGFLFLLLGLMVFMIVMSMMSARKEKKRRGEMLSSLAKHDRVLVGGGIIGTLMEVRDDEVVVRVDEATNTRITFSKASVQSILKHAGDRPGAEI